MFRSFVVRKGAHTKANSHLKIELFPIHSGKVFRQLFGEGIYCDQKTT